MSAPADEALLAAVADRLNDVAATAERAARHRDLVVAMNAATVAEADRRLTLDSDPRSLEALFSRLKDQTR